MKHWIKLVFLLTGMVVTGHVKAAVYYSRVATGTFATAGTWSVNRSGTPANATALTGTDIFIIQNGHSINVAAAPTYASITIESGGTLTVGGNYTWTVPVINVNTGGTWNISTRTCTLSGTTVTNDGSISGTTAQLTMGNASASLVNNGTFTVTTGRLNINTGSCSNSGALNFSTGRLVNTTGSLTNQVTGTITFTGTGTVTPGTGNFINNNSSSSVNFGSTPITVTGTASNQVFGGFITTGAFSCTKTSGNVTIMGDFNCSTISKSGAGTLTFGNAITVTNSSTLTISAGTFDLGTGTTLNSNGAITLTGGNLNGNSCTINESFTGTAWTGTGTVFVPGTGTVNFTASGNQTIGASNPQTFYNLIFSGSGIKTNTNTVINNKLSMEGTATASAAPVYGASAALQYNTSVSRTAGPEWITPFAATGGVIISGSGIISSNGNYTFNSGVPLVINNGATLTTTANTFTFNGDFINNGTWTPSSGDIIITGTANQNIGSFTTTATVFMTKTAGTAIFTGNVNGGNFTINGSGGTLDIGSNLVHSFTGNLINTAGTLKVNNSTLYIGGTSSGTGINFIGGTGTVHFNGLSAQNIPPFTFYDLTFSGAGVKTLSGDTEVTNVLTIHSASELDLSAVTLTLSGSGNPLVNNGTFTASGSTVHFAGSAQSQIEALDYFNLDCSGGDRTLKSSGSIGIAGIFTPGSGIFTVTGSTVDFNGSSDQTIPSFTFYKLMVSNAGIKSILAGVNITCQEIGINDNASIDIQADGGATLTVIQ